MSIYTYNFSQNLCEILEIPFEEMPSLSDQELDKIPEDSKKTSLGGSTTSGKIWITNGTVDNYIFNFETIPEGWKRGRSNCVFKDAKKQREFSSRVDRKKCGEQIKKAWDEGRFNRDHSKCGTLGDKNPAKRPEVREKMKAAALADSEKRSIRMKKVQPWKYRYK